MRWCSSVLVFLALATVFGCGPSGSGEGEQLEDSMITAIEARLGDEAPYVELRSVTCREIEAGSRFVCAAFLGSDGNVVRIRYGVRVGGDRCWKATAREVVPLTAGPSPLPPERNSRASDLSGCLE